MNELSTLVAWSSALGFEDSIPLTAPTDEPTSSDGTCRKSRLGLFETPPPPAPSVFGASYELPVSNYTEHISHRVLPSCESAIPTTRISLIIEGKFSPGV